MHMHAAAFQEYVNIYSTCKAATRAPLYVQFASADVATAATGQALTMGLVQTPFSVMMICSPADAAPPTSTARAPC